MWQTQRLPAGAKSRCCPPCRIIYPHTYTQFRAAGGTDQQLMAILERVHLEYLPAREGGWTTVKEWRDVFSGGERQRVSSLASST